MPPPPLPGPEIDPLTFGLVLAGATGASIALGLGLAALTTYYQEKKWATQRAYIDAMHLLFACLADKYAKLVPPHELSNRISSWLNQRHTFALGIDELDDNTRRLYIQRWVRQLGEGDGT